MSAPPPGNYFIYNNKLSSAGDKLAVTWNGKIDDPVTVEKLVSSDTTQIWIVDEVTSMNEVPVSPLNAPELRASWGNGVVTVSDVPNSVWNVIQADDAYAIEDGNLSAEWGVTTKLAGEKVGILTVPDNDPPTQRWVFAMVPTTK